MTAAAGSAVAPEEGTAAPEGVVVVDKPAGWTSHDVVGRLRRIAGTKRVGHAGTLDPMATGVLVCGVGRATRLLGHLALRDKSYEATIRIGIGTHTDDAEGAVTAAPGAGALADEAIRDAVARFVGTIEQVPSSVSAIKVAGQRSYARVRSGEDVDLPARPVTVDRFDVVAVAPAVVGGVDIRDVDVVVTCSTGTYVRALARDLGRALGTAAHLTRLRRTRVGPFDLGEARTLEELADAFVCTPLAEVGARMFPRIDVDEPAATGLVHGRPLPPTRLAGPVAAFDPAGRLVALVEDRPDGTARSLVVFAG
jgi:tRNA pseudouridine55 synthase